MLLLDEPVNALDRASRLRFMSFLALVRKRFEMPMLFATHDPELVLEFADAVLMLESGRLKQEGAPRSVLRGGSEGLPLPANLFRGRVRGNDSKRGLATVALGGVDLLVPSVEVGGAEEVWIRILASDLTLMRGRPEALSARNVLSGVVTHLEPVEGRVVVEIEAGELWRVYVVPDTVEALELKTGAPISLVAKATAFEVYPIAQEV
jgi:molybdate transport system ATP-binding protein